MVLMYHNVAEKPGFNTISLSALRAQLEWLHSHYEVITALDYVTDLLAGKSLEGKAVVTFDDAYHSFRDLVLPRLEVLEMPATLFVPSGKVGQKNDWDDHVPGADFPILDWAALQTLNDHPLVHIGAHGHSHSSLGNLSKEKLREEIHASRNLLEEKLNTSVPLFSYPFGQLKNIGKEAMKMVEEAGFLAGFSTIWGLENKARDRFSLHRIEVEPEDRLQDFKDKCEKRMHPLRIRQGVKDVLFNLGLRK